jgi:hypothetical protein
LCFKSFSRKRENEETRKKKQIERERGKETGEERGKRDSLGDRERKEKFALSLSHTSYSALLIGGREIERVPQCILALLRHVCGVE